jgi:phage terminase large subunit-like protein
MNRIPYPNVLIGNMWVAQGSDGKTWLIMGEDPKGQYTGKGLEPDEAAMVELKDFLDRFFRKHMAEAVWPEHKAAGKGKV